MSRRKKACASAPAIVMLCMAVSSASAQSGSLLILPAVELRWDSTGAVTTDTIISLSNTANAAVTVQLYYVNGDQPLPPVLGPGGAVIERGHPGWNRSGCSFELSRNQSTYWSALTGRPGACSFLVLDGGNPPGRPDPEHPGGRVLRGFAYIWAVDEFGREINWNLLVADALIFDYSDGAAWGYNAEAFRALIGSRGQVLPNPGELRLDGVEYEAAYDKLLLNFTASGDVPLFGDDRTVAVDTRLTLMPVSQDFRQDNDGPLLTKAKFDITNMNEIGLSGTERCISCWDQTLLSRYEPPNHFLYPNLHTPVGIARIDGVASSVVCRPDSRSAALLGVAVRIISFPTPLGAADWTGDGVVDLADYASFGACLDESGPQTSAGVAECPMTFDLDSDDDVDLRDFQALPFGLGVDRSYSAVSVGGEGSQTAVILYDVPGN